MSRSSMILLLVSLTVASALVVERSDDPFARPDKLAKQMWEVEDQWRDIAVRFVKNSLYGKNRGAASHGRFLYDGAMDRDETDERKTQDDFHNICEPYTIALMHKLGGVRATDSVNKYFKNVCYHMPKAHNHKKDEGRWHKLVCAASHDKLVRRMLTAKTALAQERKMEGLPTDDSEIANGIAKDSCTDLFQNLIAKEQERHIKESSWRSNWGLTEQQLMLRQARQQAAEITHHGQPGSIQRSAMPMLSMMR